MAALAMPPLGLFPVLALSFPIAVWLLDGCVSGPGRFSMRGAGQAALDGWCFGFGFFVAGLWWIGAAFLVETDEFAWAIPLGVLGLPAALALFTGFGFALARLVWTSGVARIFAFAFGLGVAEGLRQWLFTGFPWNGFGHGLGTWLVTAQAAALIGADGLALVTLVAFAMPATVADSPAAPRPWRPTVLAGLAIFALAAFGLIRLVLAGGLAPHPSAETVEGVRIRIVQPNVSQRDKILQRDGMAVLDRLLSLSDRATGPSTAGLADVTHLIWPESPFPFLLSNEPRALAELSRRLPARTTLITGAVRREDARGARQYFNTMHVFVGQGGIVASYDKTHLVPFGEYLPLEGVLGALGLRRFVHAPGAFSAGEGRPLLAVPGLPPVLPLICYEAIFPHELNPAGHRPGLIVNITNDAWFGETFGPSQHFAQARLRAIEQGLPLVRAANTGISGMIDPYGRIVVARPVGVESLTDVFLPKALTGTLYSDHGLGLYRAGLLLTLALALGISLLQAGFRRR